MSSMFQLGIRGVSSTAKSGFIDAAKMGSTVLSVRKVSVSVGGVCWALGRWFNAGETTHSYSPDSDSYRGSYFQ